MGQCICVGGVDLYGEVLFRVNELDEHGKVFKFCAARPQRAWPRLCQILRQRLPGEGAVGQDRGTVRVAGEDPGFRQRVQFTMNAKIGFEALAAPDIVFAGR